MVRVSYDQKPYRRSMMHIWGGDVTPSPSTETEAGRRILEQDPDTPGSLGIAISEAVEAAVRREDTKYTLGSVLNHVMLHQSVIGLEAERQFKEFGDTTKLTPLIKMYTLGHSFIPPGIHAGGLRYHGMAPMVSFGVKPGLIEPVAFHQLECFEAAQLFAATEGIIPAPETSHAIRATINEAIRCREENKEECLLFNLSGHGLCDLSAYDRYFAGELTDYAYPQEKIEAAISELPDL